MKLSALYLQLSTLLQSLWNSDSSSLKNSRIQREQPMESSEEIKWTLMPDGRGDVRVAILDGLMPGSEPDVQDSVKFLLYTRQNTKKPEVGKMNSTCRPVFKYFNSKRQSKILIHGFGDDSTSSLMYPVLTEAFLAKGDYNVFQVDWGELSAVPWYFSAKRATVPVGQHTASLIDYLSMTKRGRAGDFHLVGFSLGAHAAGIAAQNVQTGNVYRITGLDPAQVMYGSTGAEERLDQHDARIVEIVHTSGGYLGYQDPLGTRDFYPNGGSWPQPGCTYDFASVCSHRRAYYYFGEAVKDERGFTAVPCPNYDEFEAGHCPNSSAVVILGENPSPDYSGTFFLDTNPEPPFGRVQSLPRKKKKNETEEI